MERPKKEHMIKADEWSRLREKTSLVVLAEASVCFNVFVTCIQVVTSYDNKIFEKTLIYTYFGQSLTLTARQNKTHNVDK